MHVEPRHYQSFGGLPNDRHARLAARRVFVELKDTFIAAAATLDNGDWLRAQVRGAEQPEDLLLLRGHLFAALAGNDDDLRETRRTLRRSLDSLFPDSAPRSSFLKF